ncbi:MAG: hypothetical protein ABIF19_17795 [Planctomycetota bacterium]
MLKLVEFEVGELYENRKGTYEVLDIAGDDMSIRWADGEEVSTSIIMQSRICDRMQKELAQLALCKTASPVKKINTVNGWHRVKQ